MNIDIFSFVGPMIALTFIGTFAIMALVIGIIAWSIRRSLPPAQDPAVAELKGRLARGEIDPSEYQARMDALEADRA